MPANIKMNINNLSYGRHFNQIYNQKQVNIAAVPSIPSVTNKNLGTINSGMIGRIYTAKPGCGSCGK
jgi:hypothetical protein